MFDYGDVGFALWIVVAASPQPNAEDVPGVIAITARVPTDLGDERTRLVALEFRGAGPPSGRHANR